MNSDRIALRLGMVLVLAGLVGTVAFAQTRSFTMVFLTLDPNRPVLTQPVIDSLQAEHMKNIQRLANEGKLLAAGPFDGGGGLFVLSTASKDTAAMWLATDPAVRSRRWIIETYQYIPKIGGICAVAVKYEMTTYSFVRFQWGEGNVESQLMQLVDRDAIVGAGTIAGNGNIIVARGDVSEDELKKDKLVHSGNIKVSVKKLWIAKGSFCED